MLPYRGPGSGGGGGGGFNNSGRSEAMWNQGRERPLARNPQASNRFGNPDPVIESEEEGGALSSPSSAESSEPQRASYAGGYTVISPDEKKRRKLLEQAERERQMYEKHRQQNKPRNLAHVGTVGGEPCSLQEARQRQIQTHTQHNKANRLLKEKERKAREREAEDRAHQEKKAAARREAERNEQRQAERQEGWREDMRRKRQAFLDNLQAQSKTKTTTITTTTTIPKPPQQRPETQAPSSSTPILAERRSCGDAKNRGGRASSGDDTSESSYFGRSSSRSFFLAGDASQEFSARGSGRSRLVEGTSQGLSARGSCSERYGNVGGTFQGLSARGSSSERSGNVGGTFQGLSARGSSSEKSGNVGGTSQGFSAGGSSWNSIAGAGWFRSGETYFGRGGGTSDESLDDDEGSQSCSYAERRTSGCRFDGGHGFRASYSFSSYLYPRESGLGGMHARASYTRHGGEHDTTDETYGENFMDFDEGEPEQDDLNSMRSSASAEHGRPQFDTVTEKEGQSPEEEYHDEDEDETEEEEEEEVDKPEEDDLSSVPGGDTDAWENFEALVKRYPFYDQSVLWDILQQCGGSLEKAMLLI